MNAVSRAPATAARLVELGALTRPNTVAEFAAFCEQRIAFFADMVKAANIQGARRLAAHGLPLDVWCNHTQGHVQLRGSVERLQAPGRRCGCGGKDGAVERHGHARHGLERLPAALSVDLAA